MESKHDVDPMLTDANENEYELRSESKLAGTPTDVLEMQAMGKTQQLNVCMTLHLNHELLILILDGQRNFRFISILGFSCTAMSTWEIVLS